MNTISSCEMTPVSMTAVSMTAAEASHQPLLRIGEGTCPSVLVAAATPAGHGAVAYKRPRGAWLGRSSGVAVSGQPSDQQISYNTTLTIAFGAGDLGPHPEREPV